MSASDDETILEYARAHDRIVVTLDADFHALLALRGARGPSAIRLREQGLKAQAACDLIESVVRKAEKDLTSGVVISATHTLVRIKRLPIRKQRSE
jgi:predicted nuclease of predicted toxin-antitoxin system